MILNLYVIRQLNLLQNLAYYPTYRTSTACIYETRKKGSQPLLQEETVAVLMSYFSDCPDISTDPIET